jgi:hypothetical protein
MFEGITQEERINLCRALTVAANSLVFNPNLSDTQTTTYTLYISKVINKLEKEGEGI